jgi:hypothetical protein
MGMQANGNSLLPTLFELMRNNAQPNQITKNYNQSIAAMPTQQFTPINISQLYPAMYQGAQGMQGDSQASVGLLGGQGAAQSASSGAGRFM